MPIESPLRVLIVDDHIGIRIGVASLIDAASPRMRCIGAAGTPAEALIRASQLQPDVVLLDVDLAGDDGLALIPALQGCSRCSVIVLTSLLDHRIALRASALGARACLQKTAPASELLDCIAATREMSGTASAGPRE
jgi:DNA-binding NarL/FixJ family response regulator